MIPTAHLLLITRRKKQSGAYPVKVRVVFNRLYRDFRTGIDLTQEEFDNSLSLKPKKPYQETAVKLTAIKNRAHEILKDIGIFTFQKFEDEFYGRVKDASDIFPFFDEYIEQLKGEDRIKTAISYTSARNSLQKYKGRIGFYDITADWLNKYQKSMLADGNSETTVGIYIRSLRSIFNYAISKGVIKKDQHYPFGSRQFVIPAGRNIKKALSMEEVAMIKNYSAPTGSPEERARDFWLLSYLCNGINFKDIALLKNSCLDEDMLRFVRAKTKNSTKSNQTIISAYLGEPAMMIIERWRSEHRKKDDFLFDILGKEDKSLQRQAKIDQFIKTTNKYMKKICADLGLNKVATTYYSRHSAATILKKSGASVEEIREALGHKNTSTTHKYLDSFDDETKKNLSRALANFDQDKLSQD